MASLWRAVMGSDQPTADEYDGVEYWGTPERGGWLTKQGEYIKTWRRRWFVLKQGKLFWFKESTVTRTSRPRGCIPVADCLTVKGAEDVLNRQFAFELSTHSETMYFIADSEKEKEDWINAIGRSIVQHSKSVTHDEVLWAIRIPRSSLFIQPYMASPPALPISNPQSESQPPIATAAFRSYLSRLGASIRHGFSQRRPWLELLDRSAFSRPESLTEAASRVRKNFSYFRINYISLLAVSLAFSLISHPFSLIVLLSLLAAWLFLYSFRPSDQPVVVGGRTFLDREVLGILVVSTIVVVFLTSVGSLLISALLVGLAVVCTHGAFRMPEDLFLDDQEPANSGFLSFLGGAAPSAAAAAASAVAGRV